MRGPPPFTGRTIRNELGGEGFEIVGEKELAKPVDIKLFPEKNLIFVECSVL
jgi:hypothetical protein